MSDTELLGEQTESDFVAQDQELAPLPRVATPPVPEAELETATFTVYSHGECGAVSIGARTAVTAGHCVGADTVAIKHPGTGELARARVVSTERDGRDRAWLELEEDAPDFPAWLQIRAPHQGERARLLRPVRHGVLTGSVLSVTDVGARTDLPAAKGDSGSPVVGDDGALFGIATRGACSDVNAECSKGAWIDRVVDTSSKIE